MTSTMSEAKEEATAKSAEPIKKGPGRRMGNMVCYELEEVEEEVEKKEEKGPDTLTKLTTCPPDPRFQQQNKTKWCYRMFIDFQRCADLLGKESHHCEIFKKCYLCLCPNYWIENWATQIESGTFPRDLTKEMGQ